MSALRKNLTVEHEVTVNTACTPVRPTTPYLAYTAAPIREAAPRTADKTESHLKKIALFALAPFIGLAYAILLPFVGLGWLMVLAARALAAKAMTKAALRFIRNAALLVAAPFVGLFYVVAFPFIGAAMLTWFGAKAVAVKAAG